MSLSADRGSCPVLSKREREQTRSLRLSPRTVRTALEQVEQVDVFPERSCSIGKVQVPGIRGAFSVPGRATCSKGLRTGQTPPRKPCLREAEPLPEAKRAMFPLTEQGKTNPQGIKGAQRRLTDRGIFTHRKKGRGILGTGSPWYPWKTALGRGSACPKRGELMESLKRERIGVSS
jgi:hypothetical protein